MRCAECAADVPVLREFCPKCGAPTDPAMLAHRREARGGRTGRSEEELHANRKKLLVGGGALVLVLAALGRLSHGLPIHVSVHDDPRKGPAVVEAQQIYDAYHDDPASAAKRFDGREMVVSGEFLRIVPDGYGSLDMRLKTSNPEVPVGVDLAGVAVEDAKKLVPGQRVTVSCQAWGAAVTIRGCAIARSSRPRTAAAPRPLRRRRQRHLARPSLARRSPNPHYPCGAPPAARRPASPPRPRSKNRRAAAR